jgi:hypothetical protein
VGWVSQQVAPSSRWIFLWSEQPVAWSRPVQLTTSKKIAIRLNDAVAGEMVLWYKGEGGSPTGWPHKTQSESPTQPGAGGRGLTLTDRQRRLSVRGRRHRSQSTMGITSNS